MDKDLRDDMLKLVRYKVLFVKREYEHAFPEREDLVSDNLDGPAFTAWKVAEFIQQLGRGETPVPRKWADKGYPAAEHRRGGALLGLDEEDKKYLRVYYEVLERYPREKFKYEEQQIRVLEQIRDALADSRASSQPKGLDPYELMLGRLLANRALLARWRAGFAKCHGQFGAAIAAAFNSRRDAGGFQAARLDPSRLGAAFRNGGGNFSPATFDRFAGMSKGKFPAYALATGQLSEDSPPQHRFWEMMRQTPNGYVQRTTVSDTRFVDPSALPAVLDGQADITVNVYREDTGVVSWSSNYRRGRQEMPFICYPLGDGLVFWAAQLMSDRMEPLMPGVFLLFLKWPGEIEGRPNLFLVTVAMGLDFEGCRADVAGDVFWKGHFELVEGA
jgi:hypothetical protein